MPSKRRKNQGGRSICRSLLLTRLFSPNVAHPRLAPVLGFGVQRKRYIPSVGLGADL